MTKKEISELIESWENLPFLLKEIARLPESYNFLAELALYDGEQKSWRAAYLIDLINDEYPDLILPYLNRMIEQVLIEKNDSKRRHFLKLISLNEISEEQQGVIFDFCLKTFTSSKEAIAVRVHAMQVLFNISMSVPELMPEVLATIEHELENHSTPGLKSRGTKLANKLRFNLSM